MRELFTWAMTTEQLHGPFVVNYESSRANASLMERLAFLPLHRKNPEALRRFYASYVEPSRPGSPEAALLEAPDDLRRLIADAPVFATGGLSRIFKLDEVERLFAGFQPKYPRKGAYLLAFLEDGPSPDARFAQPISYSSWRFDHSKETSWVGDPDLARYLVKERQRYQPAGLYSYTNGAQAKMYVQVVEITVVDLVSGETVFTKSYVPKLEASYKTYGQETVHVERGFRFRSEIASDISTAVKDR